MLLDSDFEKRVDIDENTDCTGLLSAGEIQLVISKVQQDFITKVRFVTENMFQGDTEEVQKRLILNGDTKNISNFLSLAFECPEIRETMEHFSSKIGQIILEEGLKSGLGETDNHYGMLFKVIREALGEIFFDIAQNRDSQERLRNVHFDNGSLRVKIKHNGKSKSENFNPQNYGESKIKTVKAALRARKKFTREREAQIEREREEIERISKLADFNRKVLDAEKQLLKEGIIEEIIVKKEVLRGTEKQGEEGKEIPFIEERITAAHKIKNLKIRVDNRGSSRYFRFEKSKNGKTKSAEKWLPQHNGKAFQMILEDIYTIYQAILGREFSIYERVVLSKLGELWKYDSTR